MDVALAIDAEAVTVTLHGVALADGAYDNDPVTGTGKWVPGVAVDTPIVATVQPATGRNLFDAPEGVRTEARFAAWSRVTIRENDEITYDGERYRVVWRAPRPQDGFNKVALGKLKP